jgi:uncharacterized protein (TIGR02145 family)
MLTNLKLGSTSGTITLTPTDSNVASNFVLPQLTTGGAADYDNPKAYGPVPGDTGSGTTNYGYLYNWPAATAGATRTTNPAGSGNATNSICPANWRLPTGDNAGELAWLNAKMNNPSATAPSTSGDSGYYQNWQNSGPFRGSFSGRWYFFSFSEQGGAGRLWSASALSNNSDVSLEAYLYPSMVAIGVGGNPRSSGLAVRCLLN